MKSYFCLLNNKVRYIFHYHDFGLIDHKDDATDQLPEHQYIHINHSFASEAIARIMLDNGLSQYSMFMDVNDIPESYYSRDEDHYVPYFKGQIERLIELYQADMMFAYAVNFGESTRYVLSFNSEKLMNNALLVSKLTGDIFKRLSVGNQVEDDE